MPAASDRQDLLQERTLQPGAVQGLVAAKDWELVRLRRTYSASMFF